MDHNDKIRIEPVELRTPAGGGGTGRRLRPLLLGLVLLIAGLLLVGGAVFVMTAQRVTIATKPAVDDLALHGGWAKVHLGDAYLLWPGKYELSASAPGYHELTTTIEVIAEGETDFAFALEKLPGVLSVEVYGQIEGTPLLTNATVTIDGREGGITNVSLEAGEHGIEVQAPRYQPARTNVVMDGMDRRQSIRIGLLPGWGTVVVSATTDGAEVFLDDESRGRSPQQIELDPGSWQVQVKAAGYQAFSTQIVVRANETLRLEGIELLEANARLKVHTQPAGALVSVDGSYTGRTPLDVEMAPRASHDVSITMAGFEDAIRTVSGLPQEEVELTVELTARNGTVSFQVEPADAELLIDGKDWGKVPAEIELTAMEHVIELKREGYQPHRQTLRPKAGIPQRITVSLKPVAPIVTAVTAEAAPETEPSNEITTRSGYVLRRIGPGDFSMGASRREQGRRSNETQVNVEMRRPFYIGTREVTNGEFRAFKTAHNSGLIRKSSLNLDEQPVVNISWAYAAQYCNWLSAQEGLPEVYLVNGQTVTARDPIPVGYRLPTEAEWEYSARMAAGGKFQKYPWGAEYPPRGKAGNYADASATTLLAHTVPGYSDGHEVAAAVGSFDADDAGLYDMGGNVAEWCHDEYGIYASEPSKIRRDPVGQSDSPYHVIRGSSWKHSSITALRLSFRDYGDEGRDDVGFRICRYAEETP